MHNPMISNPHILYMKPQTSKQIIIPAKISHKTMFTIIPLVIGFQICPFLKKDIVLVSPAINNSGMLVYNAAEPILCINPSLYLQAECL